MIARCKYKGKLVKKYASVFYEFLTCADAMPVKAHATIATLRRA